MIPGLLAVAIPGLVHSAEFIFSTKPTPSPQASAGHPGVTPPSDDLKAQLNRAKKQWVMDGMELTWDFLCVQRLLPAEVMAEKQVFWPLVDQAVEKAVGLL